MRARELDTARSWTRRRGLLSEWIGSFLILPQIEMKNSEITELINRFEAGSLLENEWHHREHLLMALWYLSHFDELTAIMKIKVGILKYNVIYGVPQTDERGYHETITMFFVHLV